MDSFEVETISKDNLKNLAGLFLELWTDSSYTEELNNCSNILGSESETCFLIKAKNNYVAFIHVTIRFDYVEGASRSPTAYIEGIFVNKNYRNLGLSKQLLKLAEEWGKQKKCNQLASDTELTNLSSITFHKKAGFKEVNRIVCFIKELV
jgi:aminoglycoside 6'-N-acetyltransferase I